MVEAMQVVCVWLEFHRLGALGLQMAGFWLICAAHVQAMQNNVAGKLKQSKHQSQSQKDSFEVTWHLPKLKPYSTQMGIFPDGKPRLIGPYATVGQGGMARAPFDNKHLGTLIAGEVLDLIRQPV